MITAGIIINIILLIITIVAGIWMMVEDALNPDNILDLFKNVIKVKHLLFLLVPGVLIGIFLLKAGITFVLSFEQDDDDDEPDSVWNKPISLRKRYVDEE